VATFPQFSIPSTMLLRVPRATAFCAYLRALHKYAEAIPVGSQEDTTFAILCGSLVSAPFAAISTELRKLT